jgi:hypothetical protein
MVDGSVLPNVRFQPLQEAGATEERTLEAVSWKPLFGNLTAVAHGGLRQGCGWWF